MAFRHSFNREEDQHNRRQDQQTTNVSIFNFFYNRLMRVVNQTESVVSLQRIANDLEESVAVFRNHQPPKG